MSGQYRTYQGPPGAQRNAAPRRGPAPVGAVPHQQNQMSQVQMMQQRPNIHTSQVMHRARKPTDRNMPDGVEEIVIGDGAQEYKSLRAMEKRLDAVMLRKMMELQDKRAQVIERRRTMRIWITNTAENQPWQGMSLDEGAFDFNTGNDARYRVKIVGKLLDDEEPDMVEDDDDEEDDAEKDKAEGDEMDQDGSVSASKRPERPVTTREKLSHFVKAITIEFDRAKNLQPEATTLIEWKRPQNFHLPSPPAGSDFDTLEFERKSDENLNCTINLYRDENPERHAVSKELAEIIDTEEATRETIINGIWEYARAMDLQHDEEKRIIQCDDRLRKVFKNDTIYFPKLSELIIPHISALPPIQLAYTIRVDPEFQGNPTATVYDVQVPAPDLLRAKMLAFMQNPDYATTLRQLAALDDQLAAIVQGIADSKARHSFFTSMSRDPATFLKRWTSSQQKDLEVIMGDAKFGSGDEWMGSEFRRGGKDGVWGSQLVRESVGLMVSKR